MVPRPYSYSFECRALLYPLIQRFIVVPFLAWAPRNLKANHLTTCSLVVALLMLLAPEFPQQVGCLYLAMLLILHQLLDHIDGPLARAQGTAGVTGDLFDHATDIAVVLCSVLGACGVLHVPEWIRCLLVAAVLLNTFSYHHEFRVTRTLRVGRVGPCEVAVCVAGTLVVLSIGGIPEGELLRGVFLVLVALCVLDAAGRLVRLRSLESGVFVVFLVGATVLCLHSRNYEVALVTLGVLWCAREIVLRLFEERYRALCFVEGGAVIGSIVLLSEDALLLYFTAHLVVLTLRVLVAQRAGALRCFF